MRPGHVPASLLVLMLVSGCGSRVEPQGPVSTTPNAYAAHGNPAEQVCGNVGMLIGGFVALPILIWSPAPEHAQIMMMNGFSNITGAIVWPFFGWWQMTSYPLMNPAAPTDQPLPVTPETTPKITS